MVRTFGGYEEGDPYQIDEDGDSYQSDEDGSFMDEDVDFENDSICSDDVFVAFAANMMGTEFGFIPEYL